MNTQFSGTIGWLGVAGLVLLGAMLLHLVVRKLGGWRRNYRRARSELSLIWHAWSDPVIVQIRYRRRLRFLTTTLKDSNCWFEAGLALEHAAATGHGITPYAVALSPRRVGVLVAGPVADHSPPGDPWQADSDDPRLWWIERDELLSLTAPAAQAVEAEAPLLVCLGVDSSGGYAVLLDLLAGPASLSVFGDESTARSTVQALAAQLDARLPVASVEVASGIHQRHAGTSLAEAVRRPGVWFAVGAEQLQFDPPAGVRLISLGPAHGTTTLLEAREGFALRLHTGPDWLRIDQQPLARAVARAVRWLPEHDFQRAAHAVEVDEADDFADDLPTITGISAVVPADAGAERKVDAWN
ncbi:hypothetical protein AB0P21_39870 [Kribbella sp. NPDC056861]|uniref:hypothetical protein n=1 Tax=Kribbella sp. NPDC056861 TaxID=3154857 RepID=UPI00344478AB